MFGTIEEINKDQEDTQHGRYLAFSLGKEVYGIEIKFVIEIVGIQPIISMPEAPFYVKGIINLRGKIIPIIDMRLKFRKEPLEYTDRTCIIVVDIENISVGLIVDNVSEVIAIPDENIALPPCIGYGSQSRYIMGIGKVEKDVKLLLDSQKLLNDEEIQELSQIKN